MSMIIIPKLLRILVFATCHISPTSGYIGVYKIHLQAVAQFCWTGISINIQKLLFACAHLRLDNVASSDQLIWLNIFELELPFYMLPMAVYALGQQQELSGVTK